MNWSDIDLRPNDAKLRRFAAIGCVVFALFAALVLVRRGAADWRVTVFGIGALVAAAGIWKPLLIRPLYVALTVISFPIGWVVSRVILFVVYMVVLTPLALVLRWRGRDVLALKRPNAESYWKPKETRREVSSYFAQF